MRPYLGPSLIGSSLYVRLVQLTPKILDEGGQSGSAGSIRVGPSGIVERGADISGIGSIACRMSARVRSQALLSWKSTLRARAFAAFRPALRSSDRTRPDRTARAAGRERTRCPRGPHFLGDPGGIRTSCPMVLHVTREPVNRERGKATVQDRVGCSVASAGRTGAADCLD
jgi:hypothetical protein